MPICAALVGSARNSVVVRVLITGSSGFTGRYVAQQLLARGVSVVGLEQGAEKSDKLYPVIGCDLVSGMEGLVGPLREYRPTHVVHLAALSHVATEPALSYYNVNLVGTENLLRALQALGGVERVVLASTANVYGNALVSPILETAPVSPPNHYALSKLAMESLARLWFADLPIVITRPFNYTGVGQRGDFLIPKIVRHFAQRAATIRLGNIDVSRDFSDVRRVADIYCRLLFSREVPAVVNICSGRSVLLASVLREMERISGHICAIEVDPALVRRQEISDLRGDDSLLRRTLPDLPLPAPLSETLEWMYQDCLARQSA